MKSVIGATMVLALGVGVAAASMGGCSNHPGSAQTANEETVGTMGLALQLAPGVQINTVTYTITGNGLTKTGSIDVSTTNTITALIGGIPAGAGYTIALAAVSTDGSVSCTGSATFSVAARATTAVTVHLQCTGTKKNGSVLVDGTINVCPVVDAISATPTTAAVGATVALSAVGSDVDSAPAALTYAWSASSTNGGAGTFGTATAASTTFVCTAPGSVSLKLTASDSDCSDNDSIVVTCTGVATTPDAGSPVVDSGTPVVDSGTSTPVDSGAAVDVARQVLAAKSASCLACAESACATELSGCGSITGNAAGGPAIGTAKSALCGQTLQCVVPSSCGASSGSTCYCGTASGAGCLTPGAANGVCRTVLESSLETTAPGTIATAFGDDTLGGGRAMLLVACLSDNACSTCF